MKKSSLFPIVICIVVVSHTTAALADSGPTSIGSIRIGMSKAEYVSTIEIEPMDCNTHKDSKGKPKRSEIRYLMPDEKTLCWGFSSDFDKKGSTEHIEVSDISYDVIKASRNSSKVIADLGHSSKAIFLEDKLISLEIVFPKVGIKTLTTKYGEPKIVDNRKIETCKNRIGSEFTNKIGNLDAIWTNRNVRAILRAVTSSPRNTCTDGDTIPLYILELPTQLQKIERAINIYREGITKKEAKDSPF